MLRFWRHLRCQRIGRFRIFGQQIIGFTNVLGEIEQAVALFAALAVGHQLHIPRADADGILAELAPEEPVMRRRIVFARKMRDKGKSGVFPT